MEYGLRTPAGRPVECGRGVRHTGTITGGARYRALLGWGLLVACCVRVSWGLVGFCGQGFVGCHFWPDLFKSHEYHVYSLETNTIFLNQFQNLETL